MSRIFVFLLLITLPALAQTPVPTVLLPEEPVAEPSILPIGGGYVEAIATDGTNFLVVSTESSHFITFAHHVMLVSPAGLPLLKTDLVFDQPPLLASFATVALASNGSEYFIAFKDAYDGIHGVRIDNAGNVLDETPIEIRGKGLFDGSGYLRVLSDGTQFIVITTRPSSLVQTAARVSASGQVLQRDIVLGANSFSVSAAAAHGLTLFSWTDQSGNHLRTLSSAGELGEVRDLPPSRTGTGLLEAPDGFLLFTDAGVQHLDRSGQTDGMPYQLPAKSLKVLTPAGTSYLLLFSSDDGTLQAVHMNSKGVLIDSPHSIVSPPFDSFYVAANASGALFAWSVSGPTSYDFASTFVRPMDGDASTAVQVHRDYAPQWDPRVVWQGNQPKVAWNDFGVRQKTIGLPVSAPFTPASDIEYGVVSSPATTVHLIARGVTDVSQSPALYAQVVGSEPVLIDPQPFDPRFVRSVWTGRDFMVIWTRTGTTDILGARLDQTGKLIDGPHIIANAARLDDIAVAASESEVLVVYYVLGITHGVLLTPYGEVPTNDISTLPELGYGQKSFSVASDGMNFLVTWILYAHNGQPPDDRVGGRIIDANGVALTPLTQYSSGRELKDAPAAFWDGTSYLVVWPAFGSLWAMRIATDGTPFDQHPIHLGTFDGVVTSIARAASGQLLIAYTRGIDRTRAFTRFVVPARQRAAVHR